MLNDGRLIRALKRIADYDASKAKGYLDEWQEAAAFSACQEIARGALDPAYVTAQREAIAKERRERRERKRELIRGIGANKKWFFKSDVWDGVFVRVLPRAPDDKAQQEHCVVVKVVERVGMPPDRWPWHVDDELVVSTSSLCPEERARDYLRVAPSPPPAPPDPRWLRLNYAIGKAVRELTVKHGPLPRTDAGLELLRQELVKELRDPAIGFACLPDGNIMVLYSGVSRAL